jgi:hypothetical protein
MLDSNGGQIPRWPFIVAALGFALLSLAGASLLYFGPFCDLWRLNHP